MNVCVAGHMEAHEILSVYQTHWIRLCLTLKRLFPSMFDGDFDPKRLCLMWPFDCCIYAWYFSLCAYGALALEASLLTLVVCCCCCCLIVVAIAWRNVLQNEPHAPAHKRLVDNICFCHSHVAIVVAIVRCNMIVSRACTGGLVVCCRFTQCDMKHTRPCHYWRCGTWRWKWRALAHEALSLRPLYDVMYKCPVLAHKALLLLLSCDMKLKMVCACARGLVVVAVVQGYVKCIGRYKIEALCSRVMTNA